HPSGTPPLLPIPLPAPFTSRRADIPEADLSNLCYAGPLITKRCLLCWLSCSGSMSCVPNLCSSSLSDLPDGVVSQPREAAHAMTWAALKKMMTDKYCPRGEIKKIETEMMFPEEIDKIEKYISGLSDIIHGSVKALKPKTMQEAIEFTTELMDEKTQAYAKRQAEKKRRYDDLSKNNQNQQRQNKRQNTGQAYTSGNSDKKSYVGPKPLYSKCNYNHEGPCPPRCNNYKRVGHLAKDCRSRPANAINNNRNNNNNNQKGNGCYECGAQGHFRRNCPKLRNNDCGNQAGNDRAPAKVYVVGNTGANPDNVVAVRDMTGLTAEGVCGWKGNSRGQPRQRRCGTKRSLGCAEKIVLSHPLEEIQLNHTTGDDGRYSGKCEHD
ncbi:putative reverse transcriptase domain-containing protein, partial [Tanacetum coccineum]